MAIEPPAKDKWELQHLKGFDPKTVVTLKFDGKEFGAMADDDGYVGFLLPADSKDWFELVDCKAQNNTGAVHKAEKVELTAPSAVYGGQTDDEGYVGVLVREPEKCKVKVRGQEHEHEFDKDPHDDITVP